MGGFCFLPIGVKLSASLSRVGRRRRGEEAVITSSGKRQNAEKN